MNRWNILAIAFYGVGNRRRIIRFDPNVVNVITGSSGTGKSAIIDAIDYCLGSKNCGLPFYVREHAVLVVVHWGCGENHLIVGRNIPRSGKGTDQMFIKLGKNLSLPEASDNLKGITNRDTARGIIERAFGIDDIDNPGDSAVNQKGRATVRDITPYLFLSGDVIVSKSTLLHDMNRPEKARDIKATIPFFLGAVDQKSVLAERKLRQLEGALERAERDAKIRERSRGRLTERAMALLSQAATVGLTSAPGKEESEQVLLNQLRKVTDINIASADLNNNEDLMVLENNRIDLIRDLQLKREKRRSLKQAIKDASGYGTAVFGQSHKLDLINHLNRDFRKCPICESDNALGRAMSEEILASLEVLGREVSVIDTLAPELAKEATRLDEEINNKTLLLRECEAQISAIIKQTEDAAKVASLAQERALVIGRVHQFIEMVTQDANEPSNNMKLLQKEISELRDKVDPEAKRSRLRDSENMISNYATSMLSELPAEMPVRNSRLLFFSNPKITLIEPIRRAPLDLAEIGSDQNYLAIHLAVSFSLQKHLEIIKAPVPGLIVIDQISRPYYAEGGDEKSLEDMAKDSDKAAMRQIVRFLFDETERRAGLQVILIEHAYISDDEEYVNAIKGRWNSKTGEKLIPMDWPPRS